MATAKLLSIYLNDHLAGARIGVELARRARKSNEGDPIFGEPLARLCAEIEADHEALEGIAARAGVRRDRLKPAAAWMAERLGRLKLNGQLRGYSPLSRVLELEGLRIGIGGKQRLWAALQSARIDDDVDFGLLDRRADEQAMRVEELHREASALAFGK